MANEPTGNLNYQAAQQVCTLILELNREFNSSLVTVIHNQNLATHMERCLVQGNGVAFNSSGERKNPVVKRDWEGLYAAEMSYFDSAQQDYIAGAGGGDHLTSPEAVPTLSTGH